MKVPLLRWAPNWWSRYRRDRLGVVGSILLAGFILMALAAPFLPLYSPENFAFLPFLPPSQHNLLGTDSLGRDIFSRLIWGSRISIFFGLVVAGLSLGAGVVLGALAG